MNPQQNISKPVKYMLVQTIIKNHMGLLRSFITSMVIPWSRCFYYWLNFWIKPITLLNTSAGRLELWFPLKIYRYLCFPANRLCNFSEFLLSISTSSSPERKINMVLRLIFLTESATSSAFISQWPSYSTSDLILQKTHGNRQLIKQLGMQQGVCDFANCLHSPLNDLNGESATIMLAFPQRRAVTAPILLPHITILQFFCCKNSTTVSTCCDYRQPKLMVSSQKLRPQPMKSNDAKEYLKGRYSRIEQDSIFDEEFP